LTLGFLGFFIGPSRFFIFLEWQHWSLLSLNNQVPVGM